MQFLPQEEWGACEWTPSLPSCVGALPKRPLSFSSHWDFWGVLFDRVQGAAGRIAATALRGQWLDMDPPNCFADTFRKPTYEPLGTPHLQILHVGPQAPTVLYMPRSHTSLHHGQLSGFIPKGSQSQPSQSASEHIQKANLTLWDWKKAHKLEQSLPPGGK